MAKHGIFSVLSRIINNAGIFYEPYVPWDIDSQGNKPQAKSKNKINYPITLKTIDIQLKLELYNSIGEFKYDLKRMFDNSRIYLTNPKHLKSLKAIEKHVSDI